MALNYVTLILDRYDGSGNYISQGTASLVPSVQLVDTTNGQDVDLIPIVGDFYSSRPPSVKLLATDNATMGPSGWGWTITFDGIPGNPAPFSFFLNFADGATQLLSDMTPVEPVTQMAAYATLTDLAAETARAEAAEAALLPLPSGTPASGQIPVATGTGDASRWASAPVDWANVRNFGAKGDGATDDTTAIQAALSSFGTVTTWSQGQGGVVYLPAGNYKISKTLVIPSGVRLAGDGWGSQITLATGSGCDMIQLASYNSASQAAILGVSAASIRNAFYAGVEKVALHGDAFSATAAAYCHGISISPSPLNSAAGTDPDFDPSPVIRDVWIKAVTGDGIYHAGRSGALIERVYSQDHNGNGITPSYDTTLIDCLAQGCNTGIYLNHGSVCGTGCKSYNNIDRTWVSGHAYTAGNVAVYSGTMYFCISAVTSSTAPPSDAIHWTALAATSPAATGYGYYWDVNAAEHSWTGVDGQQNSAGDYYFKGGGTARPITVTGSSNGVNFNNGQSAWESSNPNNYAAVTFDGVSGVTAIISSCAQSQNGIICTELNSPGANTLIAATDLSEAALFCGGTPGFALVNGRLCSQPAYLPITRDKVSSLYTSAGADSATITWPSNPTAGATVLVALANVSGTPVLTDNGTTPATFTADASNTSQTNNIHIFRANNITLPASGAYHISITSGGNTFAAAAVSYLGIASGSPAGISTSGNGTSTAVAAGSVTGSLVFAAFSDSNASTHTVTLNAAAFTSEFTSNASAGLGAFGAADFTATALPVAAESAAWTLGASANWETAVAAYLPAWQIPANVTVTGKLGIASGAFSAVPFISGEDGTSTSHGALVHVLGANNTESGHYFLMYDATGPAYIGLAMALGAGHTVNGHPVIALGGYYDGLGIQGSSNNTATPIFGVLTSTQSGNGIGSTALTVYDNNQVVTLHNTLDDGSGNLAVGTAGTGLRVKEGSNAKQGTATLSSGTVTVSNTSVTASSRIFLTAQDNSTTGALRVSARTAGTSFTITSSNAGDSGVVAYEIFEPA